MSQRSEKYSGIKSSQEAALNTLRRMNNIPDPVVRYSMFLEIVRMGLDTANIFLRNYLEEEIDDVQDELDELESTPEPELTEDRKKKRKDILIKERELKAFKSIFPMNDQVNVELHKYFDNFILWISSPAYGPDHPMGHNLMKMAQQDLEELSKQ